MKKIYLLLTCVAMSLSAYAQKGAHLGVDGAFNLTFILNQNTYGGQEYEYAPTFGFSSGIAGGYNFDQHFGLQMEVKYSKQGQNYEYVTADGINLRREVDLAYTQVPLLFKYSGGGTLPTRFYFLIGPQINVLQSASITAINNGDRKKEDAHSKFNGKDFTAVFELGSDFTIKGRWYASTGLRFNYGFTDINDPDFHIPNSKGMYEASHNFLGGVHVGIHYMIIEPVKY